LNGKGYSERDEKRILDVLGRGLLKEFPNPERTGCPGSDVLKRIAAHEMPLAEAGNWLDHLTSCSPCYSDFSHYPGCPPAPTYADSPRSRREHFDCRLSCRLGIILKQKESIVAQIAVLDLRNRSIPRGTEPNPAEPPLEVNRAATSWNIYLPLGSSEGPYEVRVVTTSGESLAGTTGTANLKDHITTLRVTVSLSSARAGRCILQVRKPDSTWSSYALLLL